MADKNDWRLFRGQLDYLYEATLTFRKYTDKEHTHCEFCWICFDNNTASDADYRHVTEGYHTVAVHEKWICETCYRDFCELFHWRVES